MQRVVVFGASGSGKTTLARWLGVRLELPFTDLDDVYWRPAVVCLRSAVEVAAWKKTVQPGNTPVDR